MIYGDFSDYMEEARKRGAERGTIAGSWVVNGNTSDEVARTIAIAIDEGTFWENWSVEEPLSGEYPDSETATTLYEAIVGEPLTGPASALCDAFADA
jgi:hypothetical protein